MVCYKWASFTEIFLREEKAFTNYFIIIFNVTNKETKRIEYIMFLSAKSYYFPHFVQLFNCFLTQIKYYSEYIFLVNR